MILRVVVLAAAIAALQQPAPFRVETRLVVLQATVKNHRGQIVTGLPRDAFTVLENGARQSIVLFENHDVPVSLGLLIDNSGSMRTRRPKVEAAALDFARASNPQDEMFVLNFADKNRIDVPMTGDVHALEAGIARVDSIGGTAMRDAIAAGEEYLTRNAHRDRKVLVVITDGNDNASVTALDRIRTTAEQHEIVVYLDGFRSLHEKLYLTPNKTTTVEGDLEKLLPGDPAEPIPQPTTPPPGPNPGANRPPMVGRGAPRRLPPPPPGGQQTPPPPATNESRFGTISFQIQPSGATVFIDGDKWNGPTNPDERLIVQVTAGRHHVEVEHDGYERFITEIDVRASDTAPLNISLARTR